MVDLSYQDGRRDGKIEALEHMQGKQNLRLDTHSKRLTVLERVAWILFAVVGLIQFAPAFRAFVNG
jgi:hypothetical protein